MELEREFIWGEKLDYYGRPEEGWRPFNAPDTFDFGAPHIVSHDLMEHLNQNDFSLEGEMKASGATLLTRAIGNFDRNPKYGMEMLEVITSDMVGFLMRDPRPLPPPPPELVKPLPDWLEEKVTSFMPGRAAEERKRRWDEPYLNQYTEEQLMQRLSDAMNWMRIGFQEALAVYKDVTPRDLEYLFGQIGYAIKGITLEHSAMPGDRVVVKVRSTKGGHLEGKLDYKEAPQYTDDDRQRKMFQRMFGRLRLATL